MFGHRYFGARYYGPRYFGDGGGVVVSPPPPPIVIQAPATGGGPRVRPDGVRPDRRKRARELRKRYIALYRRRNELEPDAKAEVLSVLSLDLHRGLSELPAPREIDFDWLADVDYERAYDAFAPPPKRKVAKVSANLAADLPPLDPVEVPPAVKMKGAKIEAPSAIEISALNAKIDDQDDDDVLLLISH